MAPYRETRIFSYSFQSDFIPQAGEFNRNPYQVTLLGYALMTYAFIRNSAPPFPASAAAQEATNSTLLFIGGCFAVALLVIAVAARLLRPSAETE